MMDFPQFEQPLLGLRLYPKRIAWQADFGNSQARDRAARGFISGE
jgi:hypothetical protein